MDIKIIAKNNMNQFIEIRKSNINKNGLFVLKDFNVGEKIYSLKKGRIVKRNEINSLSDLEKMHLDEIDENTYEIIEAPGCYINHSCEPNTEEINHEGYALKKILKDDEITIDYNITSYLEKPFKCHCDSKKCRGIVSGKNNHI